MLDLLKQLCQINGTSGDEERVAEFILANIEPRNAVVRRDYMGNVLVFKKGKVTPPKTVMFTAHMDEVGFIVTHITKEGFLRFAPVGGIEPGVVFGRKVFFDKAEGGVIGVIAGKPVHLLSAEEKSQQPKIEDLLIDIGAEDKPQAESLVSPGDYCYFVSEFEEMPNAAPGNTLAATYLRSKAIDNRIGCAVMLDMMKRELGYDCVFAFTVQEEIGCRGAAAAAFNLEPDICVVLEATTACDTPGVAEDERICELGGGPVISFMDKGTLYDRRLYDIAVQTAAENNLKSQTKSKIVGGNDAGVIHKTMGGIRTIAVSAPCRYLHTPFSMVNSRDVMEVRTLAEKLLYKYAIL